MIRNILMTLLAGIFSTCTSDKKCDYNGETVQVIPGQVFISLPNGLHLGDTSYIVSPGLMDSKTFFSSDSTEYATIDYYEIRNDSAPVNQDLLIKKQNSMLHYLMKDEKSPIIQKEKVIGDYKISVLQGLFFDTRLQKKVVLCLGLVYGRRKYSELIIRRKEGQHKGGQQEINCIMESVWQ